VMCRALDRVCICSPRERHSRAERTTHVWARQIQRR
jgi:hypothetical protein